MKTLLNKFKLLKPTIALLVVFTLLFTLMGVTANAHIDDVDIFGRNIDDYMDYFIYDFTTRYFEEDIQHDISGETFMFVDSQLLRYDFLERLFQRYDIDTEGYEAFWDFYDLTGVRLWIHTEDATYIDYTWLSIDYLRGVEIHPANYEFDFSNENNFELLCDSIDEVSMCAVGIWYMGDYQYEFLYNLQQAWNDDFEIYLIYRDDITWSYDGLLVNNYCYTGTASGNYLGGYFINDPSDY